MTQERMVGKGRGCRDCKEDPAESISPETDGSGEAKQHLMSPGSWHGHCAARMGIGALS
jgi:hypothetical protein